MTGDDAEADDRPASKVARLIGEYDLDDSFGAELERLWTSEGERRESLRELADRFNRRLLERAMRGAGVSTVDGEVANLYRLLTAEDVSSGMRTEARRRLERNGVDVERLERDFVSYQAVRSYLKEFRGAEYDHPSDVDRVENVARTVRRLRSRLRSVTERDLAQLRRTERLTLGDFRLFVDVDVFCEECGTQYSVDDILERGGCECES